MSQEIHILKGSILVYKVFDIGGSVNLAATEKLFSDKNSGGRFMLASDIRKAIIIHESPLSVKMDPAEVTIGGTKFTADISARVWHYGVLSVTMQLHIPEGIKWDDMVALSPLIENSKEMDALAVSRCRTFCDKACACIEEPSLWSTNEDYITYLIEKFDGAADPVELLEKADVAGLILAENKDELADFSRRSITENALQYAKNDLAVIDWNSALVVDPDGQRDVVDVIEFCLTHLLEMRFYDDLLETKLSTLYDSMDQKRPGIMHNPYYDMAAEASRRYMEFSEFLARIENSLKTVGDSYLATVFRAASHEFRFEDWRKSTSRKMDTLAQIAELLQGELNHRRSNILEIIVIVLIAIEIVPLAVQIAQIVEK